MPLIGSTSTGSKGYGMLVNASGVDTSFSSVSLLLHGDGTNGAQNNTFIDSSVTNAVITPVITTAQVAQGTFSPFPLNNRAYNPLVNGGSAKFDGTNSLSIPQNAVFIPTSSEAFSIEAWVYLTTTPGVKDSQIIGIHEYGTNAAWVLGINSTLIPFFYIGGSTNTAFTSTNAITLNTWNHIVVARTATSDLRVYVNGVGTVFTSSASLAGSNAGDLTIGADQANDESQLIGYISNIRIVKGSNPYPANFTPPTAPLTAIANTTLLLNFTNAGVIDNALKNNLQTLGSAQITTATKRFGTGSMLFNGTTDYLSIPYNSTFDSNTTFTVEFWFYTSNIATQQGLYGKGGGSAAWSTTGYEFIIYLNASTVVVQYATGGGSFVTLTSTAPSVSLWNHVAVSFDGTNYRAYLNGVQFGISATALVLPTTRTIINIGQLPANVNKFGGQIDEFRFTKGVARYTADFTPSNAPFSNI